MILHTLESERRRDGKSLERKLCKCVERVIRFPFWKDRSGRRRNLGRPLREGEGRDKGQRCTWSRGTEPERSWWGDFTGCAG